MIPSTIIGLPIAPPPDTPHGWAIFNIGWPMTMPPRTTTNDLTDDERKWCTAQIMGPVNEMLVNSSDPYAMKFNIYIACRIVDVAAVDPLAQQAVAAKSVLQDSMCYADGQLWRVGDPVATPPPNYIQGMHSSTSIGYQSPGYKYPPGNAQYSGPYPSFTTLDSHGTHGPPKPY